MQFINAILSVPEEVDFKVHLRNEFIRLGLEEQKPVSADSVCVLHCNRTTGQGRESILWYTCMYVRML